MAKTKTVNKEDLLSQIDEWASDYLGPDFSFRERQKEAIASICLNALDEHGNKVHIIEAPTGSGKSLMLIISAGVLNKYYDRSSYILCSDLYLYSQYEDTINKYNIPFGHIKGQTGNYFCNRNQEDMRNADCRIAKVPFTELYKYDEMKDTHTFACAKHCEYIKARHKAVNSNVTLMTYQLYLYMINIVAPTCIDTHGLCCAPFKERDIVFCDECHNIPGIVQSNCSPIIRSSDLDRLMEIYRYDRTTKFELSTPSGDIHGKMLPWKTENALVKEFNGMYSKLINEKHKDDYNLVLNYTKFFDLFGDTATLIEEDVRWRLHENGRLSKEDYALYKSASWYRNYHCIISDFNTALTDCGANYLVKVVNENSEVHNDRDKIDDPSVTLHCAKEDYMVYKYLLNTTYNLVLTSATIGSVDAFEENIGVKHIYQYYKGKWNARGIFERIPSFFDFSQSPIIVHTKYKMSYDKKAWSFPHIQKNIYEIVRNYTGQRGLIQTGSYQNAKTIYENAPADIKKRLKFYNTSKEKDWAIECHRNEDDSILIGPTLTEGIDLPGDLVRFIIIAKVPYPYLGDKLVKAKMQIFPLWYNAETNKSIIQGIGRGIRFNSDWCHTFILDGCFSYLYNKTMKDYPTEIRQRITFV